MIEIFAVLHCLTYGGADPHIKPNSMVLRPNASCHLPNGRRMRQAAAVDPAIRCTCLFAASGRGLVRCRQRFAFWSPTEVRCSKSSFIEDSLVKSASNGSVRHNQPPHLNFALVWYVVGHQSLRETHGCDSGRDRPYHTGLCASNVMQLA